jgi:phenylalanyl-tRNA synthetase beta chain
MRIPVSWLRDYVTFALPLEEIARRLTMAGLEVEEIERIGGSWEGVVVGLVRAVRPHPNADRLRLVTVDAGGEPVEVVCGAPNVAEGQKIAYASVGATLIDGHTGKPAPLKAARIRGVESRGMVCSERELGISDEHEGILVLDAGAQVGRSLSEELGDSLLDIKVSPNRPDWLSVLGVAREIAVLTGSNVREPAIEYREDGPPISALASVRIDDPDLCSRYTATVITGVKVGPSPQWLVDRLKLLGQNSINNVVDVTNYAMFELGQPLHAFNLKEVHGSTVVVRRARLGEKLTALDGIERALGADVLVIADADRPIGLAGVIGGLRSGITVATSDILLESANFDAANNRRTQAALGLRTEATLRFEKGLRPELAEIGLKRATKLIQEVCGGSVARGWIDVWPRRATHDPAVGVPARRLSRVLGVEYPAQQVESTLTALGCTVSRVSEGWRIVPPYWRPDITIADDIAEELARVIGYDAIPTTVISGELPRWTPNPRLTVRERVRDALVACGMQETVSYSLTTEESLALARPPDGPRPLRVANPLSADRIALRTSLRESVLRTLARNANTWRGPIALFECGRVYIDRGEGLPEEREMAVGAFAGPRQDLHWSGMAPQFDFFDARGAVEGVLEATGIDANFSAHDDPTFAGGRCAIVTTVTGGRRRLGVVGEVAAEVLAAFDCELRPVAMFEIDIDALAGAVADRSQANVQVAPIGRFPESVRDISVEIDVGAEAARVIAVARRSKLVAGVTVFDVYRGPGLAVGKKALGLRIVYQSPERTLTSEEIDRAQAGIVLALERDFGAALRSGA